MTELRVERFGSEVSGVKTGDSAKVVVAARRPGFRPEDLEYLTELGPWYGLKPGQGMAKELERVRGLVTESDPKEVQALKSQSAKAALDSIDRVYARWLYLQAASLLPGNGVNVPEKFGEYYIGVVRRGLVVPQKGVVTSLKGASALLTTYATHPGPWVVKRKGTNLGTIDLLADVSPRPRVALVHDGLNAGTYWSVAVLRQSDQEWVHLDAYFAQRNGKPLRTSLGPKGHRRIWELSGELAPR